MAKRSLPDQLKNRTPLQDLIPLCTPWSILVSPTDYCNIKCIFCPFHGPAADMAREKTKMPLSLFENLVKQLAEFPRSTKTLIFCGRGEPTLHENLPEMISLAGNTVDTIRLTTNGVNLSPELNKRLIDSGLDYIKISVPAIDEKTIFDITGVHIDIEQYVENIRQLYKDKKRSLTVYCKVSNIALGAQGGEPDPLLAERFYSMFNDVCDYAYIENIYPVKSNPTEDTLEKMGIKNFGGENTYGLTGGDSSRPICERLFYHLTVMSNGDVFPCDLNADSSLCLGNLQKTRLKEIWSSEALKSMRLLFLKGSAPASCENCGAILYDYPNSLRKYAGELYRRLANE